VLGGAGAGEHADPGPAAAGAVAGAVERLAGALEEEALLRVEVRRLGGQEAEEPGVELVARREAAARLDIAWIGQQLGRHAGAGELGVREAADAVAAGREQLPERLDRGRAGKAPGETDDRQVVTGAHRRPPRKGRRSSRASCGARKANSERSPRG